MTTSVKSGDILKCSARVLEERRSEHLIAKFRGVTYFGEVDIFMRKDRQVIAKAMTDCHLMILPRYELEGTLKEEFPHKYESLFSIAMNRSQEMANRSIIFKDLIEEHGIKVESNTSLDDSRIEYQNMDKLQISEDKLFEQAGQTFPIEDLLQNMMNRTQFRTSLRQKEELEKIKSKEIEVLLADLRGRQG